MNRGRLGGLALEAWYRRITPAERIVQLEAENARQREQIAALVARVHELGARRAKASQASGVLPSTDGLARKTQGLCKRGGKLHAAMRSYVFLAAIHDHG